MMKKRVLSYILCLLLVFGTSVFAQDEPVEFAVYIDKTSLSENDDTINVVVDADFNRAVRGIQGTISYNKNVLECVSMEKALIINEGLVGEINSERVGKIDFLIAYAEPIILNGTLIKAAFKLNKTNTYNRSEIRVKFVEVIDEYGNSVSCQDSYEYFDIVLPEVDFPSPAPPNVESDSDFSNNSSDKSDAGSFSVAPLSDFSNEDNTMHKFGDCVGHWAEADIAFLNGLGIIDGVTESTFEPERHITRAEFTKLISAMLDLKVALPNVFSDVGDDIWYKRYIMLAYTAGIIKGDADLFRPDELLSRSELAVIADRICEYIGIEQRDRTEKLFSDDTMIPKWAVNSVYRAVDFGIITGYDGRFEPFENTTRAQSAAVIRRMYDIIAASE